MSKWSDSELSYLAATYPHQDTRDVAATLGRSLKACMAKASKLGIKKRREAKRTWTAHTKLPSSWGFGSNPGNPNRSSRRVPLGSEFICNRGNRYIKVSQTGNRSKDWRLKSHVVWEQANGTIPVGWVVTFNNGDTTDCSLENLRLISKAEIIQNNSIHNLPPEIVQLYRAKGQIIRAINRRNK